MRANPLRGPLEGVGPEMATSKRNDFNAGKSISRAVGRGWALKIETFWGPEMAMSEASAKWAQKSQEKQVQLCDAGKSISRAIGRGGPKKV